MPSIDGQFGINVNGTWNGLIGMLVRGQADMAAAGLSQTIERTKVTTFGRAFELEEFTLMSPQVTEQWPQPCHCDHPPFTKSKKNVPSSRYS